MMDPLELLSAYCAEMIESSAASRHPDAVELTRVVWSDVRRFVEQMKVSEEVEQAFLQPRLMLRSLTEPVEDLVQRILSHIPVEEGLEREAFEFVIRSVGEGLSIFETCRAFTDKLREVVERTRAERA